MKDERNGNKKKEENGLSSAMLDKILESPAGQKFDGEKLYENYKKAALSQADRAAENVFGLAAENTGGYGNSWAATAAASVYGDYADKLTEKAEQIEQTAYEREKDARADLYKQYEAAADFEDRADEKAEKQEDRRLSFAVTAAQNGDYSFLEELGADTTNAVKKQALSFAVTAAQQGDYSYLEALGVDVSAAKAEMLAKYGDYSGLAALGADVSGLRRDDLITLAEIYAEYGDYSLLRLLGVDVSARESEDAMNRRLAAARYYSLMN